MQILISMLFWIQVEVTDTYFNAFFNSIQYKSSNLPILCIMGKLESALTTGVIQIRVLTNCHANWYWN